MDSRLERGFTLEDALNTVYEDDIDVREILIEPPDSNVLTDEDSGEEDEGGTIDNLNRQQLSAHVKVRIHNGEENNQIEAAASTTQNIAERPGYAELPGRDFYWDVNDDMRNHMVSQAMRRDRFRQIPKYLHCADNTKPDKSDGVWKLRTFMDMKIKIFRSKAIDDEDDGVIVVKWLDNNVVAATSTCHGTNPTTSVKRFSRVEKKMIYVSRPSLIMELNRFMGGTDLLDENTARYRILDVSVVNAWNIYRQHENIKQLVVRRQIVQTYLTEYAVPPKGAGKPATSRSSVSLNRVSDDLRKKRAYPDGATISIGYTAHSRFVSGQQEIELSSYAEQAAKVYYGLTTKDLRKLAFDLAIADNINVKDAWKRSEMASEYWLLELLKRHPNLSIRVPEATRLSRDPAFNCHNVGFVFCQN
ncbi:hypothetical protein JTB14_037657 [Gonioctena quinquepunctata]|nr:hypothetical protein JTB14_037657 [Gonioctena quinquepunctata]